MFAFSTLYGLPVELWTSLIVYSDFCWNVGSIQ